MLDSVVRHWAWDCDLQSQSLVSLTISGRGSDVEVGGDGGKDQVVKRLIKYKLQIMKCYLHNKITSSPKMKYFTATCKIWFCLFYSH